MSMVRQTTKDFAPKKKEKCKRSVRSSCNANSSHEDGTSQNHFRHSKMKEQQQQPQQQPKPQQERSAPVVRHPKHNNGIGGLLASKTVAVCNKLVVDNCARLCMGRSYMDKQVEYETTLERIYTFPVEVGDRVYSFPAPSSVGVGTLAGIASGDPTQEELREYLSTQRQN